MADKFSIMLIILVNIISKLSYY